MAKYDRQEYLAKNKYLEGLTDICAWCGNEFKITNRTSVYCRAQCAKNAVKAGWYMEYVNEDRVCAECGILKKGKRFRPRDPICRECRAELNKI